MKQLCLYRTVGEIDYSFNMQIRWFIVWTLLYGGYMKSNENGSAVYLKCLESDYQEHYYSTVKGQFI